MASEFRLPDIGEGVAEGEIVKWHVQPGDQVVEDQPLAEVMTDKVTVEIPAPFTGRVITLAAAEGQTVKVGAPLITYEVEAAGGVPASSPAVAKASAPVASIKAPRAAMAQGQPMPFRPVGEPVLAAPATRKLARELGVAIETVSGSGPRGRVTPEDVRAACGGGVVVAGPLAPALTRPAGDALEERVPFIGMRRKIAEHLVHAKQTAPHFAYVEEVDMSQVVALREQLSPLAQEQSVSLNYLPFVIKAVIAGLRAFPALNSMLDEQAQAIVRKHYYNIGVAVSTDQGLVVPVIHEADRYSLLGLAQAIQTLAEKTRTNRIAVESLQGGTFTITSIGSIGGVFSVPIINHPEVAILGMNKITPRPVVRDGQIVIRDMMYLSLACDHRVVDGAEAARFLKHVIALLEAPGRLLVE